MSGYYPYLLCGLPDLDFGMNPDNFSYEEIYRQIFELLTPSDQRLTEFFLAFSTHREIVRTYLSWQDEEDKADFLTEKHLPRYQKEFLSKSLPMLLTGDEDTVSEMEREDIEFRLERILDREFYKAVAGSANSFVRKWFAFDLVLKNTLVAFAARKQNRSPEDEFVFPVRSVPEGEESVEPEIIVWIKENLQQRDFGLKQRLSYADNLFTALERPDVFDRERAIDRFRWNMAEEMVHSKDFQIDKVLVYLIEAGILLRWQKMKAEEGRRYLQEVVSDLRKVNLQGDTV